MPTRVSILLPAYNAAATVHRAIESLRAQTYADWELIAVDDGSTDGTREVLLAVAVDEPRLRVLTRPHGGIVSALNAGLAVAAGEFVARMDADDESMPRRLEAQVEWLDLHPDTGLVGCLVEYGGNRATNAGYALHVDWINTVRTAEEIGRSRFVESPFAHPSVMFRRTLSERHGAYRDGEFPEDYELWLRWLDAGVRMEKVPTPLFRWNDPPARLSRTDPRYSPDAFFRMKAAWIAQAVRVAAGERAIWIWGAGRPTRKRAAELERHGLQLAGYIDIDPKKATPALGGRGRPVVHVSALPSPATAFVLGYVSSRGARDLIRSALSTAGFAEGPDFLMCA
jgi:glycosyltransferase involved in cell wall biosynthesis